MQAAADVVRTGRHKGIAGSVPGVGAVDPARGPDTAQAPRSRPPIARDMRNVLGLVVACALVVGVAAACQPSSVYGGSGAHMTSTERAISQDLQTRLNQERAARGLPPLAYDFGLTARSFDWSRTMPSLAVPGDHLHHSDLNPLLGRFSAAAENIAWTDGGTSGLINVSWMNSDGHRLNMLAPNVDVVGIAVYCTGHQMWVTETFGRRASDGSDPDFGAVPPLDPIADPRTDGPHC
jgi:Cysteine-rich secretory protein family